jgi:AcrR family transcriptional regulator
VVDNNDTLSIETDRIVYRVYPASVESEPADEPVRRGRGRPMDPEVDAAIVDAAVKAFFNEGFQRMTVPGIAAEAGVAKTTVYRRYPTTVDLALAAIARLNATHPGPDTGSARDDLVTLLDQVRQRFDLSISGALLVEEREHPELLEAAREQMIHPAIERFRRVLRGGVERGELRPDLDVGAAAHALLGSFFIRYLEAGRPGPGWPEDVVATLWPALVASVPQ